MKLLELHILQSFPVSCLNRDDLGSPKITYFGGYERARVSSQCWKRAIREFAQKSSSYSFTGIRTKFLYNQFLEEFKQTFSKERTENKDLLQKLELLAEKTASFFSKIDNKDNKEKGSKSLIFLCPKEIKHIAFKFNEEFKKKKKGKVLGNLLVEKKEKKTKISIELSEDAKKILKSLEDKKHLDSVDIALFGRMIADSPSLQVEGAAMFNHAISTHEINNLYDFYTALDDCQKPNSGAGMMGVLEFNSAVYYRYVGVNLDLLSNNLPSTSIEAKQGILKDFVKATLLAVPKARQNSMNANTPVHFVLGIIRERGYPLQLVNAFESPVRNKNESILHGSVDQLQNYYKSLQSVWNLKDYVLTFDPFAADGTKTTCSFKEFCEKLSETSVNIIKPTPVLEAIDE